MTTPPGCGGRLGGSQFRTIVKSAAVNTRGWVLGCEYVRISGGSTPREEFLGLYMLDTFVGTMGPSSHVALPVQLPPPAAGSFRCATSLSALGYFCLFILAILVGVQLYHTVVLIFLPLMTNEVECFFLCVSPFWISFLVKYLFKSFAYF